jgi:hypothetical protein
VARFRHSFQGPPSAPFEVNGDSPQAHGLSHWWPGVGDYRNYVAGYNGTPTGNAKHGATTQGVAFRLPGSTNDYVNCGNPANTQGLSRLTVALWLYTDTLEGGAYGLRYAVANEGYSAGWMLRLHTSDDKLRWYVFSGDYREAVTPSAISANTWYHVVCVYDAGATASEQLKLYLDSNRVAVGGSGGGVIANSNVAVGIGASPANTDRAWSGAIRDVRIYSGVVLSPAEVWQLWAPQTRYDLYKPARRLWTVGAVAAASPPDAPSGLSAAATASDTIALAWTDNSDDETGFKIQRSPNGSTWADLDTAAADATSYNDETCSPNTTYYYRVCATNGAGDSAYTDAASAKTPPDAATLAYKYLVLDGGQLKQSDGRYLALADGAPEPDTVAGVAWLYVDQATGDLTVKFGDGHKTVIAADS